MIDLHCHILPGIDDGAADLSMAQAFVVDGVRCLCATCLARSLWYYGAQIRAARQKIQLIPDQAANPLCLVIWADVHITPNFVVELHSGRLLSLTDTRYVLVEPLHQVALACLEGLFFQLLVAGYVPILTSSEQLTWIEERYDAMQRLARADV